MLRAEASERACREEASAEDRAQRLEGREQAGDKAAVARAPQEVRPEERVDEGIARLLANWHADVGRDGEEQLRGDLVARGLVIGDRLIHRNGGEVAAQLECSAELGDLDQSGSYVRVDVEGGRVLVEQRLDALDLEPKLLGVHAEPGGSDFLGEAGEGGLSLGELGDERLIRGVEVGARDLLREVLERGVR